MEEEEIKEDIGEEMTDIPEGMDDFDPITTDDDEAM